MKISKDNIEKDYKFTLFVYTGFHYLSKYTPIMIACLEECFEYVNVYVSKEIMVVH